MSRARLQKRAPRRLQRAVVMVELALVVIPLVTMMLAAVEFGRAMYLYNQIVKATRDGARHLSGYDPAWPDLYPVQVAKNRVVYGANAPTDVVNVPGLDVSMVRVCDRITDEGCTPGSFGPISTAEGTVGLVRVEVVGYTFTPFVPLVSRLTSFTFGPIGTSMRQML